MSNFSVEVLHSNNKSCDVKNINNGKYVALPHMTEYKLRLNNNMLCRCDAYVTIDGDNAGIFRVKPKSSITIERPASVSKKFTFVCEKSDIANGAGVVVGGENNGLITVKFCPEIVYSLFSSGFASDEFRPGYYGSNCRDGYETLESYTYDNSNMSRCLGSNTINCSMNTSFNGSFSTNHSSYSSGSTVIGKQSDQRFSETRIITDYDDAKTETHHIRLIVDNQPFYTKISNAVPPRIETRVI